MDLQVIEQESRLAALEICEASGIKAGQIFVVGCSSSEVSGDRIGTATNVDVAQAIYNGIAPVLAQRGVFLAGQCCEHLNRALVVEVETAKAYGLEQVNAVPQPNHAGGAFGTVAYERMEQPVVVEDLKAQADAGMDIGGTLIGMHIRPVVVPLRISVDHIGAAVLLCARRRPKYVGGARAVYDEDLM
ncbi:MAG: TIGR01440 family protein [Clostridia bacterium]|nr:TIGR01440 family protein [Clostridia bacterium]